MISTVISTVTVAERPDLVAPMGSMPSTWPPFMLEDPVAGVFYARVAEAFPEHQLVALDDQDSIVGKVQSVPFGWTGTDEDLPDRGWDAILERAFRDRARGTPTSAVSLLEALVIPTHLGTGLSIELLRAARRNVVRLGGTDLFGPVRPSKKSQHPRMPMAEYVALVRDDGLPVDPWLRTHVRLGARIVKVCPLSMTVPGTLAQWRTWTGLPLDSSGPVEVAGALTPVHVCVEHDHAVYVEPNVWVHHHLPAS